MEDLIYAKEMGCINSVHESKSLNRVTVIGSGTGKSLIAGSSKLVLFRDFSLENYILSSDFMGRLLQNL